MDNTDVEYLTIPEASKTANRAALMSNPNSAASALVQVLAPVAARIGEQLAK